MSKLTSRGFWVVALLLLLLPGVLSANSLSVTAAAAMGNSTGAACGGSPCGLQVNIAGAATDAYVGTGNGVTDGFNNETAIDVEFIVDPAPLTMTPNAYFKIGRLFMDFTPGSGIKLVLFLQRNAANDAWRFHIWFRADTGPFQYAGGSFLTSDSFAEKATKVNVEWVRATAPGANNGIIRAWRTQDVPGASKILMFQITTVDNDTQTLDVLHLGMVESPSQPPGTSGAFYLDEVVVTRM